MIIEIVIQRLLESLFSHRQPQGIWDIWGCSQEQEMREGIWDFGHSP